MPDSGLHHFNCLTGHRTGLPLSYRNPIVTTLQRLRCGTATASTRGSPFSPSLGPHSPLSPGNHAQQVTCIGCGRSTQLATITNTHTHTHLLRLSRHDAHALVLCPNRTKPNLQHPHLFLCGRVGSAARYYETGPSMSCMHGATGRRRAATRNPLRELHTAPSSASPTPQAAPQGRCGAQGTQHAGGVRIQAVCQENGPWCGRLR